MLLDQPPSGSLVEGMRNNNENILHVTLNPNF